MKSLLNAYFPRAIEPGTPVTLPDIPAGITTANYVVKSGQFQRGLTVYGPGSTVALSSAAGTTYAAQVELQVQSFTVRLYTDAGITEVVAGVGYTAQTAAFTVAGNGAATNNANVVFGPATGAGFGTVTHYAVFRGSTRLALTALGAPITVADTESLTLNAGSISVTVF